MSDGFESLDDTILLSMVEPNQEAGNYEDDLINNIAHARLLASIDTKTGAPANVRAAVSAAQTEEDRLLTLKNL